MEVDKSESCLSCGNLLKECKCDKRDVEDFTNEELMKNMKRF